ncbi:hypothetical protein, partial [Raoultella ornithinolytica]|uniref:hypothetical protein n=1 Tax=Raoultella ornithinolytica TaxID=54291 RepID=UPI00301C7602
NTDDLFVGKTLLHGDVLMWLMKTLLTSRCVNQRGAGQLHWAVTTGGFDSETVQDVMPGAVERRFGSELPASPV